MLITRVDDRFLVNPECDLGERRVAIQILPPFPGALGWRTL